MRYEAWSTSDQALTFGWGGGRGGKPFPRLGTKTMQLFQSHRKRERFKEVCEAYNALFY